MILPDNPLGFIRKDELLNLLTALSTTDCDPRTLAIVAQATGVGPWFERQAVQPVVFIEQPKQIRG